MSAIDVLLDRLERVTQTGSDRWRARCPAHDGKSQTLSVHETGEGRTLVHCFAGCDVTDVLTAVGLTVSALFERTQQYHLTPTRSAFPAREALALIDHEVLVATLIIDDVLEARTADAEQWQRLALCASRIGEARDGSCPVRPGKETANGA